MSDTKKVRRVREATVKRGAALMRDPRVPAKTRQKLGEAAFRGVLAGKISYAQLCRISGG